jgi:ribosomal protein S18 acetylase RimI-like enzyme
MQIIQTKDYEIVAMLNQHVHKVHSALYPEHFKEYDFVAIRDFFKNIIDNPKFIFLLIEENGENLGYAWIEIKEYAENAFRKKYDSVYVHQISISESHRSMGYGSKLMEKIYEVAREKAIHKFELDYWTDNERVSDFYRKQGFVKYREFVYKDLK